MPRFVFVGNEDEGASLREARTQHFGDEGGERAPRKPVYDEGQGMLRTQNGFERALCLGKFPIETNGFKNGLQVGFALRFGSFLFGVERHSTLTFAVEDEGDGFRRAVKHARCRRLCFLREARKHPRGEVVVLRRLLPDAEL